ncbi:MAG TPA: hypothetical protein VNT99_12815, partial [Methylomirabilota bacterium]|nr:hypothetical protein [Methylomirabilota bacterium]
LFFVPVFRGNDEQSMKKYHSTIMVVDDDPNDLIFIERAFRAIGVKDPIHVVNDGLEAIAYMMGEGKFADRDVYALPHFHHHGFENAWSGRVRRPGTSQEQS